MEKEKNLRKELNDSNILKYLKLGYKDKNWYRDCEATFINLFGEERVDLVAKLFAATSINTSLKSNITLFRKALYEIENDLPIGNYLPNIKQQLEQIRRGKDLSGRKISNFAKAMSGDPEAVVVDIWLLRAYEMDRKYFRKGSNTFRSGGATDREYTLIENDVKSIAKAFDFQPREICSMIWGGVRIHFTGDRNTHYKEILTAKLQNLYNII